MRERWARALAILTGLAVLAVSALFAVLQNPREPGAGEAPAPAGADEAGEAAQSEPLTADDAARLARGRAVYEAQGCRACHAIAGDGNPRNPLDGVGARLDRAELRAWVVGDPSLAEELSSRVLRRKQAYAGLPSDDLEALLDFLAREAAPP